MTYGAEERALKLAGTGDIRFGAAPLLRAALSARQLDADRFIARDSKDNNSSEPVRAWPALRALAAGVPHVPIPAQIEFTSEQVMLGGRPLQDIAAELHGDAQSWRAHKLEFRAPGTTKVSLSEAGTKSAAPDEFKAALNIESGRSRCTDDLAAGPRRHRLSQPEAAAAARRRHRGARWICDRRHEGRDRWRHCGGEGCGVAPPSGQRLADRCGIEVGASRSRCRHRPCTFSGGPARRMA